LGITISRKPDEVLIDEDLQKFLLTQSFAPYDFFYAWRRGSGLAKDLPAPKPFEGKFCVYVLKCSYNSFYIGQTNDLGRRIDEHKKRKVSWTSKHLPIKLIHWEYFYKREEAAEREDKL
jgi:predicted GIY-YIG superfamily endonuclease